MTFVREMTVEELFALPVSVSLKVAARALGVGQSTAYEQAAAGEFVVPVKKRGPGYRVNRADILRELGYDPHLVRAPEAAAS